MKETTEKFTKAWDNENARIVDVRELPRSRNGLKCGCSCVECQKPLEACQGFVNSWYFRHLVKSNCTGGPMSALHLLAQELLNRDSSINTRNGVLSYVDAELEWFITDAKFRADVSGIDPDGQRVIVEVCISHQVDDRKIEFIRSKSVRSIEIDLSDVNPDITRDELLDVLLNDVSKQRIIFWQMDSSALSVPAVQPVPVKPWYEELVPVAFVVMVLIGGYKMLTRKSRRSSSRKKRH